MTGRCYFGIQLMLLVVFSVPCLGVLHSNEDAERRILFRYETTIPEVTDQPVDLFIPIATTTYQKRQTVIKRTIDSPVIGEIKVEKAYGNTYWHGRFTNTNGKPAKVTITYELKRRTFRRNQLDKSTSTKLGTREQKRLQRFLKANQRVPISGRFLDRIKKDIYFPNATLQSRSRAIYDFVIDNMEYKKLGSGWGNGDTFWACSKKYGNCTDFHALFISLGRSEKIPTRFEIGFPIPLDRKKGTIKGYHCWVGFYLPDVGWVPVDASEAKKHPEKREMFYGTQPADRIRFTVGRDLRLGPSHRGPALNYFIFPHGESNGKVVKVETKFSFEEL